MSSQEYFFASSCESFSRFSRIFLFFKILRIAFVNLFILFGSTTQFLSLTRSDKPPTFVTTKDLLKASAILPTPLWALNDLYGKTTKSEAVKNDFIQITLTSARN